VDLARSLGRAWWVLCWVTLALLAAFTIIRIWQPGESELVVGMAAVTPWPYFLAWVVAVAALIRRKWRVAGVALAFIAIQIVLLWPTWRPDVTAAPAVGSWRLKVFDANVRFNNLDLHGIAEEIANDHPDVVTLEEFSEANEKSLLSTGAVDRYHWRYLHPSDDSTGFAVWSDVPLTGSRTWYAGSHAEYSGVLNPAAGGPISLLVVHTYAPYGAFEPQQWANQLAAIKDRAARAPRPLIVAGDFNATGDMRQFRSILNEGLVDSAVARGQGWQMTWPRNHRVVPPFLRPDHVLYSAGLTATSYSLGHGAGSDHRPVKVTLARAATSG